MYGNTLLPLCGLLSGKRLQFSSSTLDVSLELRPSEACWKWCSMEHVATWYSSPHQYKISDGQGNHAEDVMTMIGWYGATTIVLELSSNLLLYGFVSWCVVKASSITNISDLSCVYQTNYACIWRLCLGWASLQQLQNSQNLPRCLFLEFKEIRYQFWTRYALGQAIPNAAFHYFCKVVVDRESPFRLCLRGVLICPHDLNHVLKLMKLQSLTGQEILADRRVSRVRGHDGVPAPIRWKAS